MFDYESLRLIWWVLIGVLMIGFAVTDGFDMGVAAIAPAIGKNDTERRIMLNTIAPHWDGNQVWLITAGGALFAAWPLVYATSFSVFYLAMYLTLAALWLRPLGLDYRSKIADPTWRKVWDYCLCFSGVIPPIIFGVAFGNLLQGIPFELNDLLMSHNKGSFWALLNPFALLSGVLCLTLFVLQMKTSQELCQRARALAQISALIAAALFIVGGVWVQSMDGYMLTSAIDTLADSNPLNKTVVVEAGAWMHNFDRYPAIWAAPILGAIMPLLAALASRAARAGLAFFCSSLANAGVILTAGFTLFPFVMPSSLVPSHSLTMWDSTASELTLGLMTLVAAVMVPIILAYTSWSYYKMFGRIDKQHIENNDVSAY